ncbi:exopolyphosphatase [Mycobacteroides abscessus subsp. abscessus]|nr:exopolyphosphatase [Mycobacteroides abscessus subsp. abscessus]
MARDRHLPHTLATVHPKYGVPYRAEILVGLVISVFAATADLRGAIGFSSFAVLVYYAVANASAWTLTPSQGRPARIIPAVGLVGCVIVSLALPLSSVAAGTGVLAVGVIVYALRRVSGPGRRE